LDLFVWWARSTDSHSSFYAEHYLQLPHALVKTLEGQQTPVDRTLAQLGTKRHVALSLPFFVPAIFAIAKTDLVPHCASSIGKNDCQDSRRARRRTAS